MATPRLNNMTIYVAAADFADTCAFYRRLFPEVLFDDGEHILCLAAGPDRAVCIHVEGELGHRAGDVEAIFWIDELDHFRDVAVANGLQPDDIGVGLRLTDPTGRSLRFITPPA